MFVVLVVGCYTANLAAFLTVTNIGTTINTVEELMGQSQVQYGLIKDSGVHQLLKVTTTSIFVFVCHILTVILISDCYWFGEVQLGHSTSTVHTVHTVHTVQFFTLPIATRPRCTKPISINQNCGELL